MYKRKALQSLANLEKALGRLEEALNEKDVNSLYIDGTTTFPVFSAKK
ncbi:hypothetical protein [Shouchella shacheensis]|nr:hypothetical protein [Shouchella shacheensis]